MVAWFAPSHLGNGAHQRFDEDILIGQMFGGKINRAELLGGRWIKGHINAISGIGPEIA